MSLLSLSKVRDCFTPTQARPVSTINIYNTGISSQTCMHILSTVTELLWLSVIGQYQTREDDIILYLNPNERSVGELIIVLEMREQ